MSTEAIDYDRIVLEELAVLSSNLKRPQLQDQLSIQLGAVCSSG